MSKSKPSSAVGWLNDSHSLRGVRAGLPVLRWVVGFLVCRKVVLTILASVFWSSASFSDDFPTHQGVFLRFIGGDFLELRETGAQTSVRVPELIAGVDTALSGRGETFLTKSEVQSLPLVSVASLHSIVIVSRDWEFSFIEQLADPRRYYVGYPYQWKIEGEGSKRYLYFSNNIGFADDHFVVNFVSDIVTEIVPRNKADLGLNTTWNHAGVKSALVSPGWVINISDGRDFRDFAFLTTSGLEALEVDFGMYSSLALSPEGKLNLKKAVFVATTSGYKSSLR